MKKIITFGLGAIVGSLGTFYLIASGKKEQNKRLMSNFTFLTRCCFMSPEDAKHVIKNIKEKSNEVIK